MIGQYCLSYVFQAIHYNFFENIMLIILSMLFITSSSNNSVLYWASQVVQLFFIEQLVFKEVSHVVEGLLDHSQFFNKKS